MSLFEPELQNLLKLDTLKGLMWKVQGGHVQKGTDWQESRVHRGTQGNPVKWSEHVWQSEFNVARDHDVCLCRHRKEKQQELQHPACFPELSFWRASVGSGSALWPKAAHGELLRGVSEDMGMRRDPKMQQQRPVAADFCCGVPAEAELKTPIPSLEITS